MFLFTIFTSSTRRLRLQTSLAAVTMDNSTALLDIAADLVAYSYNYGKRLAATPVANFFRCNSITLNSLKPFLSLKVFSRFRDALVDSKALLVEGIPGPAPSYHAVSPFQQKQS
jgi:hypothetical protein